MNLCRHRHRYGYQSTLVRALEPELFRIERPRRDASGTKTVGQLLHPQPGESVPVDIGVAAKHVQRVIETAGAKLGAHARDGLALETAGHEAGPGVQGLGPGDGRVDVEGDAEGRDMAAQVDAEGGDLARGPVVGGDPDARVGGRGGRGDGARQGGEEGARRVLEEAGVGADRVVCVVRGVQVEDGPEDELAGPVVGCEAAARGGGHGRGVAFCYSCWRGRAVVRAGCGDGEGLLEACLLGGFEGGLAAAEGVGWCWREGDDGGRGGHGGGGGGGGGGGVAGGFVVEQSVTQGRLEGGGGSVGGEAFGGGQVDVGDGGG